MQCELTTLSPRPATANPTRDSRINPVAILFARKDSVYKQIPPCDVYDIDRDARTFPGGMPAVCHPPCRAWGRLRHFAKPRPDEKALALFAVDAIRNNGGVLEHPDTSTLWKEAGLPLPGQRDSWGGHSILVNQHWFGHRAEKRTLLYIVGCEPRDLPPLPIRLDEPTHVVQSRKRQDYRPHISKAEREHTPLAFAEWLCEVARRCSL